MNISQNRIAILPLGAHEYHGPHLPADTDTLIAQGIIDQLKVIMPKNSEIEFLPVEEIGYSIEHKSHKSTKTLSYDEAIHRWIKIGENCYRAGIRKLLFLNAHGGNSPLLTIVTTELRSRFKMLAVVTSWRKFGLPKDLAHQHKIEYDIHAGFLETSLILALKPQAVFMEKAENFSNRQKIFIENFNYLRAYGGSNFGWLMSDLNQKGACGHSTFASQIEGEKILDYTCKKICLLLQDMQNFDLNLFDKTFISQ